MRKNPLSQPTLSLSNDTQCGWQELIARDKKELDRAQEFVARDLVLLQEGGMFQDMERLDVSWKMFLEGSLPGLEP